MVCSGSIHANVWMGMVLSHGHDYVLAQRTVEEPPTVNDLARLLADAMHRPMAWMIQANGFMLDARHLRGEIQEEAYRKGLIPFVPGSSPEDKPAEDERTNEDIGKSPSRG